MLCLRVVVQGGSESKLVICLKQSRMFSWLSTWRERVAYNTIRMEFRYIIIIHRFFLLRSKIFRAFLFGQIWWNDDQQRAAGQSWVAGKGIQPRTVCVLFLLVLCECVWCAVKRVERKYFFHLFERRARTKRDFSLESRRVYIRIGRSGGGEEEREQKRITHAWRVSQSARERRRVLVKNKP
jgi:hypothetical protein